MHGSYHHCESVGNGSAKVDLEISGTGNNKSTQLSNDNKSQSKRKKMDHGKIQNFSRDKINLNKSLDKSNKK